MRKILDVSFMIGFIGLQVCLALAIFDPYGEWLANKILRAITFGILFVTYPLISIVIKGIPDEERKNSE